MKTNVLLCCAALASTVACGRTCPQTAAPADAGTATAAGGLARYVGTLEEVQKRGQLRVLTWTRVKGALPRAGTPLCFERDLAADLAKELGVELVLVEPPRFVDMLPWLEEGRGDVLMASLTPTDKRKQRAAFTRPLRHVRKVLIGPAKDPPLEDVTGLAGKRMVVHPGSSALELLTELRAKVPELQIEVAPDGLETLDLIEGVARGAYAYTVVDTKLAAVAQGYIPNIKVLLELSEPQPQAWAVHRDASSLLMRVNAFLDRAALTSHLQQTYTGDLDEIQRRKVLRVLTRNNGVTYYLRRGREAGLEYELARAFADKLGVRLEMVIPPARRDLVPWLLEGKGDLVAAMLVVTDDRQDEVSFGAPYASSSTVVVTRRGAAPLTAAEELAGRRVHVRAGSAYQRALEALSPKLPQPIEIAPIEGWIETEEVLRQLADGKVEATVAYSNLAEAELRYEPELVIGPALDEPRPIAWAVRKASPQLKAAVDAFFTSGDYKPRGLMYNIIYKRYLGRGGGGEDEGAATLAERGGAISPYDDVIKAHARSYRIDWRLVAAQMYQESRFDPTAVSPVGALGLMQVMPATARGLGVGDVRQTEPGIHAGVKYMRQLLDGFDPQLDFRQRYRFALASYNAGLGHLEDARRLATSLELDRDRWFGNTEKAMLLLEKTEYARRARYGFCRGREPVRYVSEIQTRYEAYSSFSKE